MFAILYSIALFLLLLTFLVIIHELGHYLVAKFFGVRVDEFGVGLPPKARTLFRRWGTEFTLNWLPIGGFVKLAGEERAVEDRKPLKKGEVDDLFYTKGAWPRTAVLLAGPLVNFVFGIIVFGAIFTVMGIPQPVPLDQGVVVVGVAEDSPAAQAELEPMDLILAIIAADGTRTPIANTEQFIETVSQSAGETLGFEIEREEETLTKLMYVRTEAEIPEGSGALGVAIQSMTVEFVHYPWWQQPFRGAWYGMVSAVGFGGQILMGLGSMVGDLVSSGQVPADVSGPVGIARVIHQERLFQEGLEGILNIAAVLSINLAIINLLPIPALDGGRIMFVLVEKLVGNKFRPKIEQYANLVGFVFLIGLILLITIKDVGEIVSQLGWLNRLIPW